MIIRIKPDYDLIKEKEYCCVPAVLQMIQKRRGIAYSSQDEIGCQLGLIVPPEKEYLFSKVRVGKKPRAGWGTQISKEEFSITNYFQRNSIPLKITIHTIKEIENVSEFLSSNLRNNNDIILCYNSQLLFGEGDVEHVSLVQRFESETGKVTIVDPAINVPEIREVQLSRLEETLRRHEVSSIGGFWVIS
jgi:hypothetical protein